MKKLQTLALMTVVLIPLLLTACGGNKSTNSLSKFSPEIINNVDAFQFQITNADNVSTTVMYRWENTGTQATINHSTTTTSGSASIQVMDADSVSVYNTGLVASANEPTTAGTAGSWYVRVTFVNYSGTANFRLEKL